MDRFEELVEALRTRSESEQGFGMQPHEWNLSDWFVAMMGELGEAANIVKKLNRKRHNDADKGTLQMRLEKEMGDLFCYVILMSLARGFNILDAAVEVFNAKSQEIGYPVRLSDRMLQEMDAAQEIEQIMREGLWARSHVIGEGMDAQQFLEVMGFEDVAQRIAERG